MSRVSSKAKLQVQVLAVSGTTLQLEGVTRMQVLLEDGSWLGIRPGHAALISATHDGNLKYSDDDEEEHTVYVKSGILTLRDNVVRILTTH